MRVETSTGLTFGRAARLGVLTGVLAASGCSASIDSPTPSVFDPSRPPGPTPSVSPSPSPSPTMAPRCDAIPPTSISPGRVILHRLNRAEYDNTLRDLVGDTTHPGRDFPPDDHGYGFDNIADVLAVSPLLFEKWFLAGESATARLLASSGPGARTVTLPPASFSGAGAADADGWNLYVSGDAGAQATVTAAGEYELSADLGCQLAGPDPCRAELRVDDRVIRSFDVTRRPATPVTELGRVRLTAGAHRIAVGFTNDYYDAANQADRNLIILGLSYRGPLGAQPMGSPQRAQVMRCEPADDAPVAEKRACARTILEPFGLRAFRRPLETAELDRLVALAEVAWTEQDPFATGIGLSIQALLLSPNFVFRVEKDDPAVRTLDGFELASRLSYFLWSSTPDEALLTRAQSGALADPATLAGEVRRMLADPRASALTENFAGQWLETRALENVNPDSVKFPRWDRTLAASMRRETQAYFSSFVTADRSILDLLDSPVTFIDDRLAAHYGVPAPGTATVTETRLAEGTRRGLLGQGSILTVTSQPRRTSPVKRGKWVLEQLLCEPPDPPPAGVTGIAEDVNPTASLRERMQQHARNPVCAGCHLKMDPIGFGLERFDAVGAIRTQDDGFDIDDSGVLPGGATFSGPVELARILRNDPRFPRCFTQKLLTYALGRGLSAADTCQVEALTQQFAGGEYRIGALAAAIAQSRAFTLRAPEAP